MPVSAPNDPDLSPPPSLHPSQHAFDSEDGSPTLSTHALLHKKKHICTVCNRAFSTSGHLARHARIHTGERNHKCPFPGCETRCSRQDNLQQHYRIHLSPGSRRNSGSATRAAMSRANSSRPRSSRRRSANTDPPMSPLAPSPPLAPPSPPIDPPPLAQAYPEPPDTPPPLAPAYPTLTAPIYTQQLSARDSSRSSRTTPDAAYHSPVSYAHAQLASASGYPAQYQSDDGAVTNAYPPSSHSSRASTSYGRVTDDGRWPYHASQGAQGTQGDHSYPASEPDRYSPSSGSPANAAAAGQYPHPISPVDSLGGHARYGHGDVQMSPQESAPNGAYFNQPYARQAQNQNSAVPPSASPVPYGHAASQPGPLPPSSHRHSIAHISHPNPVRQHSPSALSTSSASPVVSTPPTPAYGFVGMGGYSNTESPPENVSPVTPGTGQAVYSSYESSELAGAGYSHPPPAPMAPHVGYDASRTLPVPVHARDPHAHTHGQAQLHFDYGQAQAQTGYAGEVGDGRGYSPRPVLAPIQDVRTRGAENGRYAGAGSPQPPMQSLASVSRHQQHQQQQTQQQQHAFAYPEASASGASTSVGSTSTAAAGTYTHPPPGYAHAHAHGTSSAYGNGNGNGNDGGYAHAAGSSSGSAEYYYHPHQHAQRERSPEVEEAEYGCLELHQPQPQAQRQYMQTGAGAGGQAQGHGHGHGHPVWRAEGYVPVGAHVRGRLVQ
ncbi:hypothetical protein K466DRAFT_602531 [Polyporus arcularius HHB13444]|uniref:C2H2-type domain-containing protein n=1 Tax=Polyporus arcularius HHB13444 TaxID=1314778 RepID=A0A5C3P2D5_9APHY|nr:hypothetical protein K466DRAFT_602531 [Polyporus arcularius HHB13444]